ncbi:MAG: anthranilate phosphoribosyltransferase [Candidatus Peribacteraceae bacterium]|nr:anthranilate phosphoribosyltransferase [Candidatus Peribacteraceae bacterium]
MKTLILDNYDSFTFNLYQEIGSLGGNPFVVRNDAITVDEVSALGVTHIVIGPGPGNPYTERDTGISEALIEFAKRERIPLLGVCLGHQVLGTHFGAVVSRAPTVCHGTSSSIRLQGTSSLFTGLMNGFPAMRYHSLRVEEETIPPDFSVTAFTDDGIVMAMEHRTLPLFGIQFHPESIGTPDGKRILQNFLSLDDSIENLLNVLLCETTPDNQRKQAFTAFIQLPITPHTLSRSAKILRSHMVPVHLSGPLLDTCGTGGSGKKTINTSTIVAFLVAACGGKVAKHGNRSASGNCGCFDLLELLGVNILLSPDNERRIFDVCGIVFLFAPFHHPALRHVASLRKTHGRTTIFNLLGPLCNPASASRQLLGTGSSEQARMLADALTLLGTEKSVVVAGMDGLDEISASAPTVVYDAPSGSKSFFIPSDLGLSGVPPAMIEGGTPAENAQIFLDLARGGGTEAMRRLVLLNAAHSLVLAGLRPTLHEAYALAREKLLSGSVEALFLQYRSLSTTLS